MVNKIRASARGEECTFQIPGVCNHDPETVVLCHAPSVRKGMGYKSPDLWGAYGCHACHDEMDGRTYRFFVKDDSTCKAAKYASWFMAIDLTHAKLQEKGLMPS